MKLVIEHYGKFLLEGLVVVALMALIFTGLTDENGNKGIFAVTGAQIQVEAVDYQSYSDFKNTYKAESEKENPKITSACQRLAAGAHTLSSYITAEDNAGQPLDIRVSSIKSPDGVEILDTYNADTSEILLTEPGEYLVTVSAVDGSNRMTKVAVRLPVNTN